MSGEPTPRPSALSVELSILEVESNGFNVSTTPVGCRLLEGPPAQWEGAYPSLPEELSLDSRQRQVMQLTSEGIPVRKIASRMFLSPKRISVALEAARREMGALNTPHTIRRCLEAKVVMPPTGFMIAYEQLCVNNLLALSLASRGWTADGLAAYTGLSERVFSYHRRLAIAALGCRMPDKSSQRLAISIAYGARFLQPDTVLLEKLGRRRGGFQGASQR